MTEGKHHIAVEEMFARFEARKQATGWKKVGIKLTDGVWAVYRFFHKLPLRARRATVFAYQRLTRGWDDSAVWSLDTHLAKTLGAQLIYMADIAHGYPGHVPGDGVVWTFETWTAALRTNGEALLEYDTVKFSGTLEEADALYEPAQDALRWVADNFGSLWD